MRRESMPEAFRDRNGVLLYQMLDVEGFPRFVANDQEGIENSGQ
jgi:hypothetical protein